MFSYRESGGARSHSPQIHHYLPSPRKTTGLRAPAYLEWIFRLLSLCMLWDY